MVKKLDNYWISVQMNFFLPKIFFLHGIKTIVLKKNLISSLQNVRFQKIIFLWILSMISVVFSSCVCFYIILYDYIFLNFKFHSFYKSLYNNQNKMCIKPFHEKVLIRQRGRIIFLYKLYRDVTKRLIL